MVDHVITNHLVTQINTLHVLLVISQHCWDHDGLLHWLTRPSVDRSKRCWVVLV